MGAFGTIFPSSSCTTTIHLLILLVLILIQAPASTLAQLQDEEMAAEAKAADAANRRWAHLPRSDVKLVEFPLNLEYLECEYFLWGSMGKGMDVVAPELVGGGPPPIGAMEANLDNFTRDIIEQFALQEVGHVRAIKSTVKGFPRPQLDLSRSNFAKIMDQAFGQQLEPPFDPYANSINYLISSYVIPYVGLTDYVGANPRLKSPRSKRLVAGLLAVESGQDAIIRALLYQEAEMEVAPYNITVAEFTSRISELRNELGRDGIKDEGIIVNPALGAEGKIEGNVIAGNEYSLAYMRTPQEILRIVCGTGSEREPGGFYPEGASGSIAGSYLR
ncbi:hypothetical protein Taro_012404 [Colocasia esculenta]|uniref:Desiccation-related protein PCC13-62 n=1 Tax=Colocasia esculenta TaxID=4460 RepID=A0A843UDF3_COLES|nr:hypothetical protein [Colocasia esculenta]